MKDHTNAILLLAALVAIGLLFWATKEPRLLDMLLALAGALAAVLVPKTKETTE